MVDSHSAAVAGSSSVGSQEVGAVVEEAKSRIVVGLEQGVAHFVRGEEAVEPMLRIVDFVR